MSIENPSFLFGVTGGGGKYCGGSKFDRDGREGVLGASGRAGAMVLVEGEGGGLRQAGGLPRGRREVLGDTGDTGLFPDEVFRGGVDGRRVWEIFDDLGDNPLGGSFSYRSTLTSPSEDRRWNRFTLISDGFSGVSGSRTSLLSRVAKGSIPSEPSIVCSLTISTVSSRSVFCELVCSLRHVTGLEEKPTLELKSGTGCGGDWDELAGACTCGWP